MVYFFIGFYCNGYFFIGIFKGLNLAFWWCDQICLGGFNIGNNYCFYQYYSYGVDFCIEEGDYMFIVCEQGRYLLSCNGVY